MAFKRRTKRGGGGNRTSETYSTKKGVTRSVSWSSTGTQKTGSGGARYTTRYNPDGSTTKTVTRHLANGFIDRKQKTYGKPKAPKPLKITSPKRSRVTKSKPYRIGGGKSFSKNDSAGLFLLAMIFGGAWVLVTYWQWVVAVLVAAGLVYVLIKLNK